MSDRKFSISADFLEVQGRRLFYLLLTPVVPQNLPPILFVPPFAEEMHLSRRSVAAQARKLAAAGRSVMLLDLTGCGDADGEFAEASWQCWQEDVQGAANHLKTLLNAQSIALWGLRLGGLLAARVAAQRSDVQQLLLWQPVLNGEQQIDQFLRLLLAADVLAGAAGFDRGALWQQLRDGHSLEIAGYDLSPGLALPLGGERLATLNPDCAVIWLEVAAGGQNELSLAASRVLERWREQGLAVSAQRVNSEPFWRNLDSGASEQLFSATLAAMVAQ